jgi:hypothetical protein
MHVRVTPSVHERPQAEIRDLMSAVRSWQRRATEIQQLDPWHPNTLAILSEWRVEGEVLKQEADKSGAAVLARNISELLARMKSRMERSRAHSHEFPSYQTK